MPLLDDTTIRELLRADYARLVNAVALVSGSFAAAEDAVQEAIVRAWTSREPIGSPASWVAVVAMNLSRSTWRRTLAERRARERERLGVAPTEDARAVDERVDVARALGALPRRQREVAVLRYFLQLSTQETATALGVSTGTVKNSLAKARASLAVALREIDDVEVTPDAGSR
ncbi:MAG: RNA polymerase sigma factor [Actinomycetota bacterium]